MTCGTCKHWKRLVRSTPSRGFCNSPEFGPDPYWRALFLSSWLLTHKTHGGDCQAHQERGR